MNIYNLTPEEEAEARKLWVSTDPQHFIDLFRDRADIVNGKPPIEEEASSYIYFHPKLDAILEEIRENKKEREEENGYDFSSLDHLPVKEKMKYVNLIKGQDYMKEVEKMVKGLVKNPSLIHSEEVTIHNLMQTRFALSDYMNYFLQPSIESHWSQNKYEELWEEYKFHKHREENDFIDMELTIEQASCLIHMITNIIYVKQKKGKDDWKTLEYLKHFYGEKSKV